MPQLPTTRPRQPALSDSPWFWTYLFCTAALVGLALAAPKYARRQTQLERQFLARQEGGQAVMGVDGPVSPSSEDNVIIPLGPLFVVCGVILAVAWFRLWSQRIQGSSGTAEPKNG